MKKIRIFLVRYCFNTDLGRSLLTPVYLLTAWLIKILIQWRFPTLKVWPRNSLVLNDLVPGLSDIDLTLYNTSNEHSNIILLNDFLKLLRLFIPIFGEANYYEKGDIKLISKLMNPFEVDRDPYLRDNLCTPVREKKRACEIVYILRSYKSDYENLHENADLRTKKWSRIFKSLQYNQGYTGLESVEKLILSYLKQEELEQELFIFPHLWLGVHWADRNKDELIQTLRQQSDFIQEVCLEQISWEIAGILTQLPFLNNPMEMKDHFSHLLNIAKHSNLEQGNILESLIAQASFRIRKL